MLSIQTFTFNPFQENTYVITDAQHRCWIVDPGMFDQQEQAVLFDYIRANELQPQAIINTHTHIDHILGVDALATQFNIPFFCHRLDLPILQSGAQTGQMLGIPFQGTRTTPQFLEAGHSLLLGDEAIDVRFVPGHSPGSIAFFYEKGNWVISGDTLFAQSIGRTDLMGGDYDTLINSIRTQLLSLPANTTVYAGHGPATNIGFEQEHNPFLQ